jgi:hypothetical protein
MNRCAYKYKQGLFYFVVVGFEVLDPSGPIKCSGNFRVAVQPAASQKGIISMELVSYRILGSHPSGYLRYNAV